MNHPLNVVCRQPLQLPYYPSHSYELSRQAYFLTSYSCSVAAHHPTDRLALPAWQFGTFEQQAPWVQREHGLLQVASQIGRDG